MLFRLPSCPISVLKRSDTTVVGGLARSWLLGVAKTEDSAGRRSISSTSLHARRVASGAVTSAAVYDQTKRTPDVWEPQRIPLLSPPCTPETPPHLQPSPWQPAVKSAFFASIAGAKLLAGPEKTPGSELTSRDACREQTSHSQPFPLIIPEGVDKQHSSILPTLHMTTRQRTAFSTVDDASAAGQHEEGESSVEKLPEVDTRSLLLWRSKPPGPGLGD
ncbi:unnamed protein product [Protopolystoma xenopodis]|uniref:Uncharacterized protein n=1 Tax=Protopolystoma xenopodis TaxID=117903 RepID=A0A3S5BR69_9PLAT|nr:unnamed protein product [Protopolystoma xenopodis]